MHYWNRIGPAWLVPVVVFLFGCGNGDPAAPEPEVEQRSPPTVSTAAITDVTNNSAIGGGEITSDGGAWVSPRGVVWSTKANPTLDDHEGRTADGGGPGSFTSTLSDLEAATNYYVRAYATNTEGTAYGSQVEFTTDINRWTRKADFGGGAGSGRVGLAIGEKGYVGFSSSLWEYDPEADTWTQRADFEDGGGTARFSAGGKGYFGDLWEYDPQTNAWTEKAEYPGPERWFPVWLSIGDKGYVVTGSDYPTFFKDLWEYDPSTDSWTQRADFPGPGRDRAVGFSIGGKGYVGTGTTQPDHLNDLWEYDPATDAWTRKADFGGMGRYLAVGLSIGGKGYIGTGLVFGLGALADFWEYDPGTDTWIRLADFGGGERRGAFAFSIGGKGYIGTGGSWDPVTGEGIQHSDFWEYDPG
jgi:N-acetylneuraminic acid mutarotase